MISKDTALQTIESDHSAEPLTIDRLQTQLLHMMTALLLTQLAILFAIDYYRSARPAGNGVPGSQLIIDQVLVDRFLLLNCKNMSISTP